MWTFTWRFMLPSSICSDSLKKSKRWAPSPGQIKSDKKISWLTAPPQKHMFFAAIRVTLFLTLIHILLSLLYVCIHNTISTPVLCCECFSLFSCFFPLWLLFFGAKDTCGLGFDKTIILIPYRSGFEIHYSMPYIWFKDHHIQAVYQTW